MSLPKDFDKLDPATLTSAGLDVELHPTKPLVLIRIEGTAVVLALDDAGVQHLATSLMDCHALLWDRVMNGKHS